MRCRPPAASPETPALPAALSTGSAPPASTLRSPPPPPPARHSAPGSMLVARRSPPAHRRTAHSAASLPAPHGTRSPIRVRIHCVHCIHPTFVRIELRVLLWQPRFHRACTNDAPPPSGQGKPTQLLPRVLSLAWPELAWPELSWAELGWGLGAGRGSARLGWQQATRIICICIIM